jgi:hypothetical protein
MTPFRIGGAGLCASASAAIAASIVSPARALRILT